MTLEVLNDFLINENWREPLTEWKKLYPLNPYQSARPTMSYTNVTFLGVGRNLGSRLPVVLQQIEMLANEFSYSRAIFVEGGSNDNTGQILKEWANISPSKNRTIITMPGNDSFEETGYFKGLKLPREGRLSNARNVGLSHLFRLVEEGMKTEYVIIVDLDVLGWDPHGVIDSFKKRVNWDVVCANGILLHGIYRDTYAFRTETLNTNHHWAGNDEVMYNITAEEKKKHRQNLKVRALTMIWLVQVLYSSLLLLCSTISRVSRCFIRKSDFIFIKKLQHFNSFQICYLLTIYLNFIILH